MCMLAAFRTIRMVTATSPQRFSASTTSTPPGSQSNKGAHQAKDNVGNRHIVLFAGALAHQEISCDMQHWRQEPPSARQVVVEPHLSPRHLYRANKGQLGVRLRRASSAKKTPAKKTQQATPQSFESTTIPSLSSERWPQPLSPLSPALHPTLSTQHHHLFLFCLCCVSASVAVIAPTSANAALSRSLYPLLSLSLWLIPRLRHCR